MSEKTDQARRYALDAHGDQRYGIYPYAVHLDAVVEHLQPYGETAQVIGYLHDVVEDTDVQLTDLEEKFGAEVAQCVGILTDEPGKTRKEKKTRTYEKMQAVEGPATLALIVKAADRLANIEACIRDDRPDKLAMYREEHPIFREAAYREGMCDDLWKPMDELFNE